MRWKYRFWFFFFKFWFFFLDEKPILCVNKMVLKKIIQACKRKKRLSLICACVKWTIDSFSKAIIDHIIWYFKSYFPNILIQKITKSSELMRNTQKRNFSYWGVFFNIFDTSLIFEYNLHSNVYLIIQKENLTFRRFFKFYGYKLEVIKFTQNTGLATHSRVHEASKRTE